MSVDGVSLRKVGKMRGKRRGLQPVHRGSVGNGGVQQPGRTDDAAVGRARLGADDAVIRRRAMLPQGLPNQLETVRFMPSDARVPFHHHHHHPTTIDKAVVSPLLSQFVFSSLVMLSRIFSTTVVHMSAFGLPTRESPCPANSLPNKDLELDIISNRTVCTSRGLTPNRSSRRPSHVQRNLISVPKITSHGRVPKSSQLPYVSPHLVPILFSAMQR